MNARMIFQGPFHSLTFCDSVISKVLTEKTSNDSKKISKITRSHWKVCCVAMPCHCLT